MKIPRSVVGKGFSLEEAHCEAKHGEKEKKKTPYICAYVQRPIIRDHYAILHTELDK